MSNETRTYISAVIMRNITGAARDSIAAEIEHGDAGALTFHFGGELREVYLPSAVRVGQSRADQLRAQAFGLIFQAELIEAEERAPRPYIAHDGPAGLVLVEPLQDLEADNPDVGEDVVAILAEDYPDAIYFLHPYETQEV